MLFINRQFQYVLPGQVPMQAPLYAFIDLLGNTRVVSIVPGAQPPSYAAEVLRPVVVDYGDRLGPSHREDPHDEVLRDDLQPSTERDDDQEEGMGVEISAESAVVGTGLGIPFLALAPLDPTLGFCLVASAIVGIVSWATANHPPLNDSTGRQQ